MHPNKIKTALLLTFTLTACAENETPIHVLKELGGWADLTMVLRYAHLSSEHLSEFAENAKVGTNKLHAQKSPANEKRRRA